MSEHQQPSYCCIATLSYWDDDAITALRRTYHAPHLLKYTSTLRLSPNPRRMPHPVTFGGEFLSGTRMRRSSLGSAAWYGTPNAPTSGWIPKVPATAPATPTRCPRSSNIHSSRLFPREQVSGARRDLHLSRTRTPRRRPWAKVRCQTSNYASPTLPPTAHRPN